MRIGVCYYPEQTAPENLVSDLQRMKDTGISLIRVGEFAWSKVEPRPGDIRMDWLKRVFDEAGNAGLKVCLGTPTACPPAWMVDRYPEMLSRDLEGTIRRFGSRRHYCFSSEVYLKEAIRITRLYANTFCEHEALDSWQIDNEFGCHSTVLSFSNAALKSFRKWLRNKYTRIENLNELWGNTFWSMEYSDFDQIFFPRWQVTEANPIHTLEFRRFSSDQVINFCKKQVEAIKSMDPSAVVHHNLMGHYTDFDHFKLGELLDIVTWDSYPLGFLALENYSAEEKADFYNTGHPDFSAFHNELYRSTGRGKVWVMENQCGPVNWAPYNPAPAKNMIKIWGLEAMFHGADVFSVFRWRQAKYAQEQNHSGILDFADQMTSGGSELAELYTQIKELGIESTLKLPKEVALVFDYDSHWINHLEAGNSGTDYFWLILRYFECFRSLGFNVSIVHKSHDLSGYQIIAMPSLNGLSTEEVEHLMSYEAVKVAGPRFLAKDELFTNFDSRDILQSYFEVTREHTESLPPGQNFYSQDGELIFTEYLDKLISENQSLVNTRENNPIVTKSNDNYYIAANLVPDSLQSAACLILDDQNIKYSRLPKGVRSHKTDEITLWTAYCDLNSAMSFDSYEVLAGVELKNTGDYVITANR